MISRFYPRRGIEEGLKMGADRIEETKHVGMGWGYSFPAATVTQHQKRGDLKQQKLIALVLEAARPESGE